MQSIMTFKNSKTTLAKMTSKTATTKMATDAIQRRTLLQCMVTEEAIMLGVSTEYYYCISTPIYTLAE